MRESILDQLPKALPREKIVLVVGSDNQPGINAIKSLIENLNREGEWIRSEFRGQFSESHVSGKVGVVLTMVGTRHGSLVNVRRAASSVEACCPNQALTAGETKEALRVLFQLRKGDGPPVLPENHNGKEVHQVPVRSEAERLAVLSASAKQTGQVFSAVIRDGIPPASEIPDEVEVIAISDQPSEPPDEVETALAAIENFRESCDETQVAVLMVGDRLKVVAAERDDLQRRLSTKDEEIAQLRSQLDGANGVAERNAILLTENKGLEGEVRRLQTALDALDNLIKGVRQK